MTFFKPCIEKGQFPNEWKKANVVLVHKKGDKQVLRNCRPVSKIFERVIYNNLYEFFIKTDLISSNQSGFKQGDSSIYQLLSITHEIYQSFDNGFEVRDIFLDIAEAFDKVWHKGLIFKLKHNGVTGDLLNILKLPHFKVKHNYFKNSLFPPTMIEWNRQSIKTFVIPKVSLV